MPIFLVKKQAFFCIACRYEDIGALGECQLDGSKPEATRGGLNQHFLTLLQPSNMFEGIHDSHIDKRHGSSLNKVSARLELLRKRRWHASIVSKMPFTKTVDLVTNLEAAHIDSFLGYDAAVLSLILSNIIFKTHEVLSKSEK
jgi:hypothetical protein